MKNPYVGQRIVCIDGSFSDPKWTGVGELPVQGQVYTVRGVREWQFPCEPAPTLCVYLQEIKNPVIHWRHPRRRRADFVVDEVAEHPFPCERFRPVVDTSRGFEVLDQARLRAMKKNRIDA